MILNGIEINRVSDNVWEIPQHGNMRVPGRVYSSRKMLEDYMTGEESLTQLIHVAELPGIQKWSLAMPDIHWGYGFPIGGVAAFDMDEGIISPGGVGYDINCGVRLIKTAMHQKEIYKKLADLTDDLFQNIPTGIGSAGAIKKLTMMDMTNVALSGAAWAVDHGYGRESDLEMTEDNGTFKQADPDGISKKAFQRGQAQLGTLGSGNHFLEIDAVEQVFDEGTSHALGLFKGQIVVMIHTGSRGFGYQVCDDYLKELRGVPEKYGIKISDRQLTCAPVSSAEGKKYFSAMACAANFAWANRQVIMALAEKTFMKNLGISDHDLKFSLLYDVAHNIAKTEAHVIDGNKKQVMVHRKGATRSFPKGHSCLPKAFKNTGQPVLIPGDMGRYSYVAVGSEKAMQDTFGSTCHGAGRVKSRKQAVRESSSTNVFLEMEKRGVVLRAKGRKTVAEEMPYAYKDVANVVEVMNQERISLKIARLKPLAVIKG